MPRSRHATPAAPATLTVLASIVPGLFAPSPARAQCSNDVGFGDIPEGEVCLVDLGQPFPGPVTDGCNLVPNLFNAIPDSEFLDGMVVICGIASNYNSIDTCDVNADCPDNNCVGDPQPGNGIPQGQCQGPSEPSVNRRDTDWHRISAAALAAADFDGNGVIQLHSDVNSEFNSVTFFVSLGNPTCATVTVLNGTGCGGPQAGAPAQAVETIEIDQHPNGIVAFVAPGLCSGAGIFDGYECADVPALNDYILTVTIDEPPTGCADPDVNPGLLPCNTPNAAQNGCDDPACCKEVCAQLPLCCVTSWSQQCADMAIALGCASAIGGPVCIATGPNSALDGYLQVCPDPLGGWADLTFGGAGDLYNPTGGFAPQPVSFSNAFFLYRPAQSQRELLSNNPQWKADAQVDDSSLATTILCVVPGPNCIPRSVASDVHGGDGVLDHLVSKFRVTGVGVDLTFDLTQDLQQVPVAGGTVSVLEQTYSIHNNTPSSISFVLLRQCDLDAVWNGGFTNDSVGTGTNSSPLDRFVFQGESGLPVTDVTISSPQGQQYVGAKQGVDPDGPGIAPPMGAGTDVQEWNAYGVPIGWGNFIAFVGYNVDGESGAQAGDGHIDLEIPVTVPGNGTVAITIHHTYGGNAPGGVPPVCGDPAAGPCIDIHPNPGCYDFECCAAVCALNPFCCEVTWDITCLLTILSNNITSCFDFFEPPQEFIAAGEPVIHVLEDFDNTGTIDVAAAIPDLNPNLFGRLQVFRNLGEDVLGTWLGLAANAPMTVGRASSGVAAGLFNSDDDVDLAVSNAGDDNVYVFLNFGAGNATFFLHAIVPVGNEPSAITSGDLNEDSLADLAVTNKADGTVTILLGDGNGNFMPLAGAAPIFVGGLPIAMTSGDFDGNKCPDLVGSNRGAVADSVGTVFVLLSNGGANYQPPVHYNVGTFAGDLAIGQLGGVDGSIDIAVVNNGSNDVSFLMNQGDGTFFGPLNLAVGTEPLSIDVVDADSNGLLDISVVATTGLERTEQVFLNQGGFFSFSATLPKSVLADANFVVSGLMDENAYDDLVTVNEDANPTGGSVTVLLNDRDCPWDCGDGDGEVGVVDFLNLLGTWGSPGNCDYDGNGVDVTDFLDLLAHWGACP